MFCHRVSGSIASLLAVALVGVAGCTGIRPDPAAEQAITQALGLRDSVVFLVEGGPIDESSAGAHLSFDLATHRAALTDPGLQEALARVRVAIADADQVRLLPNPLLNFVTRWGSGRPNIEVSLTEGLAQFLQRPQRASAADNRLRQAAADSVAAALNVVATVQENYLLAQSEDRLLSVLAERQSIVLRMSEVAQARLSGGEGTVGEVTTLAATLAELDAEIAAVKLRRRAGRLKLARLVGEPSGDAAWTLDPWRAPSTSIGREGDWLEVAARHRPEIQSAMSRLAALGDDYALARLLPWSGSRVGVSAERPTSWFIGPSLSLPIPVFDMGQAARARATVQQIEARHALTRIGRLVVQEVRVAHQALMGHMANRTRLLETLIPLQERRREQAEQAYVAGFTDVTPLYLAEQDLGAARSAAIEVERQLAVSLVRLHRAVGGRGSSLEVSR